MNFNTSISRGPRERGYRIKTTMGIEKIGNWEILSGMNEHDQLRYLLGHDVAETIFNKIREDRKLNVIVDG